MRKTLAQLIAGLALVGAGAVYADGTNARDTLPDDPDLAQMPEGAGKAEVYYACASCHSLKLVIQQGMNKRDWNSTLDYMVDEHGMEPLDHTEKELILSYLAKHYGRDRPNYPR